MTDRSSLRLFGALALSLALMSTTSLTAHAQVDVEPAVGDGFDDLLGEIDGLGGDEPAEAPIVVEVAPDAGGAVEIPVPSDPIARAAFDVLDTHCARCHQDGALSDGRLKPAKNFGFVLMLDQLAVDPHYIVPGNPDGSRIVTQILNKEMPYDVFYEANLDHEPPTEDEVAALRTWITSIGEMQSASCASRDFVTPTDMTRAMANDLERLQSTRIADTRYVTLTHLYNACADNEEMEVYRQATVKLLNSLSRVSDVLRLETVDEAGTIVRFNLKDLGWQPEDWDRILSVYPYAAVPDSQFFDLLSASTLTQLPYIRGDWFAFTASQPPLYDKLLGLSDTFDGLQADLGVDIVENLQRFVAKRAGFQVSGVSRNNRLIERHTIPTGYFWTSYDFAGNGGRQSLFSFPLGPGDGEFDFEHDGGESIFSLPNGFQAYYLNTADGAKLDKGPTQIVLDPGRRDQTVTNGISCMGCHDQGIRKAKDDVLEHVMSGRTFPKSVRDAVEALYPTHEEMDGILEADTARFQTAMLAAGLEPTLKWNGVEMINALSKRYENDVEMSLAAAEFGQDQETFLASLGGAGDPRATRLGRRLDQGLVPRDTFESQFDELVERVSDLQPLDLGDLIATVDDPGAATVDRPVSDRRDFDLALISDSSGYKVNDLPVFTVTSEESCFLTLINIDDKDHATVIYPNQYQQDNFIEAGTDLKFPTDDSPFQYRLGDPGTETVIALCSLKDKPVDNIEVDHKEAFKDLGDYEEHVTRAITIEPVPTGGKKTTPDDIVSRAAIKLEVQ